MTKSKNMQKAERESLNIKDKLLEALKASVPEVFAEGRVNWDKIRLALGECIEAASEKFNFTWAGKAGAVTNVLIPSKATLKPDKKESVKFETSENLFIEGDNLEALKLLQKPYFEKVKMIYIDPPYNTGNDFVYKDDFRQPLKNYLEQSGQVDSDGNRLSTNTQASGRFHSAWLTMMYPRLKLAWNLLRHDGVIFVSIDDNEAHHLRMMMDEIFGEENFVGELIRKTKSMTGDKDTGLNIQHENLICYAKNIENIILEGEKKDFDAYDNSDNDPSGYWTSADPSAKSGGPSLYFEIKNPFTGKIDLPPKGRYWAFSKGTFKIYVDTGKIKFKKEHSNNERGFIFKRYKNELQSNRNPVSSLDFCDNLFMNQIGTKELRELLGGEYFSNPKPVIYIEKIIYYSTGANDIILDFFAGSATTAHAVLAQNQEDGGKRKFILIQMPEPTDPKSEAYKAGYKTIADIAKERIRRVIKGYGNHKPIDDGFKVFKLGTSNYYDNLFEYSPEKSAEENDKAFKDYLNKSQEELFPAKINELDIVYENIIKEGLSLNDRIDEIKIGKNKVYKAADSERELLICLDEKLSASAIDALTDKEYKEKIFICFDAALTDSDKANLGFNRTLKTI